MSKGISNGSLFQRKDGFWCAVVCLGNGKRKQIPRKTKEEARSAMTAWLMENGYIEWELSGDLSVSVIMDEFIQNHLSGLRVKRNRKNQKTEKPISSRTIENYIYMLQPFKERFGGVSLKSISTMQLNGWLRELENTQLKNGQFKYGQVTLDRIVYITNAMFQRAQRKQWISVNPFDSEDFRKPLSRKETQEITGFSDEELAVIIPALQTDLKLFAPFTMLMETGMRTEELLALQ